MAVTLAGITAAEMWDGYRKGRAWQAPPFVIKKYTISPCTTAQADAFVDALQGSVVKSTVGGSSLVRTLPHACPENPNLFCLAAEWEGRGETGYPNGGTPQFNAVVVTATYGLPPYPIVADPQNSFPNDAQPFAEDSLKSSLETITLPNGSMKFSTAPQLPIDVGRPVNVGRRTFTRMCYQVPFLPFALLDPLINTLNNATFWGQPMGQLRFDGWDPHVRYMTDGSRVQDIEIRVEWREVDWNKFPRRDSGAWDFAVDASTGTTKRYTYADFSPISLITQG